MEILKDDKVGRKATDLIVAAGKRQGLALQDKKGGVPSVAWGSLGHFLVLHHCVAGCNVPLCRAHWMEMAWAARAAHPH
jgi:hypothetical protein